MMKNKIDSPPSKRIYGKHLTVAEPPFAHMQEMGLTKLMLRGRQKVNGQWQLMRAVHNLKKIHGYGGEKLLKLMSKAENR